jgi:hypothetical protein
VKRGWRGRWRGEGHWELGRDWGLSRDPLALSVAWWCADGVTEALPMLLGGEGGSGHARRGDSGAPRLVQLCAREGGSSSVELTSWSELAAVVAELRHDIAE